VFQTKRLFNVPFCRSVPPYEVVPFFRDVHEVFPFCRDVPKVVQGLSRSAVMFVKLFEVLAQRDLERRIKEMSHLLPLKKAPNRIPKAKTIYYFTMKY
jgi:hypothetical protein